MNTEIIASQEYMNSAYPIFKPIFLHYISKHTVNGKLYEQTVYTMKAFKPAEIYFNQHPDKWPLFLNDIKNCLNLNHKASVLMEYMKISRSGARNWIEDKLL